jgi:phosphatidylserine synthase
MAIYYFILNRIFDCVERAYAKVTESDSEFGAYLDTIIDYTIYGLVPVSITINQPSQDAWIVLGILEVVLTANAATLFVSSGIIAKYTKPKVAKSKYATPLLLTPKEVADVKDSFKKTFVGEKARPLAAVKTQEAMPSRIP